MSPTSIFRQHRALRWLIPVGVVSIVGVGGAVTGGVLDSGSPAGSLNDRTAAQLVSDVRANRAIALSGTVIVQLALVPSGVQTLAGTGTGTESLSGLLTGSHTMRYWYGGPDRQRIVLLGATDEIDVFRVGNQTWQWDSAQRVASHSVRGAGPPVSLAALMPQQLATQALAAIDSHTSVDLIGGGRVADRPTYQLALTPHDVATRVGSVRIAVDASTHVALGVQIYARGRNKPVIDASFASVSYKAPPAALFAFSPPPGATVVQAAAIGPVPVTGAVTFSGSGWTSIVEYRAGREELARLTGSMLRELVPVQGSWGRGRLLESPLLCALVTDDGRLFAGAVDPEALYDAAATR